MHKRLRDVARWHCQCWRWGFYRICCGNRMKGTAWLFQIRHFSVKCADTSSDVQSPKPGCLGTKRLHASHSKISKWFHKLALPHFFLATYGWLDSRLWSTATNDSPPTCNEDLWRCGLIFSEIATFEVRWIPPKLCPNNPGNLSIHGTKFTMKRRCFTGTFHGSMTTKWRNFRVLASDSSGASVLTPLSCTWIFRVQAGIYIGTYIDYLRPIIASSWLCDYFMELKVTKRYLKRIIMHVLKISWKYIESSHQNLNLHQFVMCGCFFSSSPVWCLQSGAFKLCFIFFKRCLRDEFASHTRSRGHPATRWVAE